MRQRPSTQFWGWSVSILFGSSSGVIQRIRGFGAHCSSVRCCSQCRAPEGDRILCDSPRVREEETALSPEAFQGITVALLGDPAHVRIAKQITGVLKSQAKTVEVSSGGPSSQPATSSDSFHDWRIVVPLGALVLSVVNGATLLETVA
jgi:hypothetical protein